MLRFVEKDNGRTVNLHVGDYIQIVLPENPSTGYRWAMDHFSPQMIEAVDSEPRFTSEGTAGAIGSGGRVEVVFRAKAIGSGAIALKYWRPWEGDASIIERFALRIHVEP